jgi:hypothetical protein
MPEPILRRRTALLLFVALSVDSSIGRAGADASQIPPLYVLQTTRGDTIRGPLLRIDAEGSVEMGGDKGGRIAERDIVTLRQEKTLLPPTTLAPQAIFANGDRLVGDATALQGERLRFKPAAAPLQELLVPLSTLAGIWLAAPEGIDDPARFLSGWLRLHRRRDAVLLRNGDVVEGALAAFGDRAGQSRMARVHVDKKDVDVDLAQVAAVALAREKGRPPRVSRPSARIVALDGSRLRFSSITCDGGLLTGATLFGAELRIPLRDVVAVEPYQSGTVYLSDLAPRDYQFTPYFGEGTLPYAKDVSIAGNEFMLAGSAYDKGIGMRSQSRLTYDLKGGYRCFTSVVGLDDRTGREGTVRIRVLVDGKLDAAVDDRELTARNGPRALRVDVSRAHELTLVVEYGRRGNVQGHVDWADARLIK